MRESERCVVADRPGTLAAGDVGLSLARLAADGFKILNGYAAKRYSATFVARSDLVELTDGARD